MKKKVIAIVMSAVLALTLGLAMAGSVGANGSNLIVNGDFESGNTGFGTEYSYLDPSNTGPWTLGPEYLYTVSTDPSLYHSAWSSFGDHTSGTGKMMIVNGTWDDYTPDYNAIVWEQTVDPLECVEVYPVTSYALYAGQHWEIGEVQVKTSADGVCVKFVLTDEDAIAEDWLITQVHVAVAEEPGGIPQTKKGNPIPGKFPVNVSLDPGVTETDWYCLDWEWDENDSCLVIAAHAQIELAELGQDETGWGAGGCEVGGSFGGKNWATYICYCEDVECDYGTYLLEFWAANSYPGSVQWPAQPAILQVEVNDEYFGTLALDYTPPTAPTPGWKQFSDTWSAGTEDSAHIVIRDTRHIMYGDDFCIDDISFVRQ